MSNSGQVVLTVVGTAIGFAVGYPALGFYLGSLAGQAFFPTQLDPTEGPRLKDRDVQTVEVGVSIPKGWGTFTVAGNVIWSSGLIEEVNKETVGGKGGPEQEQTTYTYFTNLLIGICEGPVAGIRRIWANGVLIYDVRAQQPGESDADYNQRLAASQELADNHMEFYTGDETDLPDSTMEAWLGAGNVPAYRGLAKVMLRDLPLADFGNRPPSFLFEVPAQSGVEYSGEVYPVWVYGNDPRNSNYEYLYKYLESGLQTESYTGPSGFTADLASILDSSNFSSGVDYGSYVTYGLVTPSESVAFGFSYVGIGTRDSTDLVYVEGGFNRVGGLGLDFVPWGSSGFPYAQLDAAGIHDIGEVAYQRWPNSSFGRNANVAYQLRGIEGTPPAGFHQTTVGVGTNVHSQFSITVSIKRQLNPPVDEDRPWTLDVSGRTFKRITNLETKLVGVNEYVSKYPINDPTVPDDDPNYDDEDFWTAAYEEAVSNGLIDSGLTYGVDYPEVVTGDVYYRLSSVADPAPADLADIVNEICDRCGLLVSQVNTGSLDDTVDGYLLGRQVTGRQAIEPLRSYSFFDYIESQGVLKFVPRGLPSVGSLEEDELAAHYSGDKRPPVVETERQQDVELPQNLKVRFISEARDYEPDEQFTDRITTSTENIFSVEVPIVMTSSRALRTAEVLMYELWTARNSYKFSAPYYGLEWDPADCLTLPIDGYNQRVRIVGMTINLPGFICQFEAVRDDDGQYDPSEVDIDDGALIPSGSISYTGETELVLLDLPALRDEDGLDAGYYAAMKGSGSGWHGASVLVSNDDGGSYLIAGSVSRSALIGELQEVLPVGSTTTFDEGNEIVVSVSENEAAGFENASEASIFAGANLVAIGADGRWNLVQFKNAEYDPLYEVWHLSGLLQGRKGTEWAVGTSQVGDSVVLLTDGGVTRVSMEIGSIGFERRHKAQSFGKAAPTDYQVFASEGVALKPYSVVDVQGVRDGGGDLTVTFLRRGRIGRELMSGVDIPLSEVSEEYEVDIYSGASVVRTITVEDEELFTYTAAEQTTDFGSTQSAITMKIYQMSATVGRGYETEATI